MISQGLRRIGLAVAVAVGTTWVWFESDLLADGALYKNGFQDVQIGAEPEDFLVLDGAFTVQADGDERWLELPGSPLDNFGALFGPSLREGSRIRVSVMAQSKRRLAPAFGVGVNGLGGFRFMVSANKRMLELFQGEDRLHAVPFRWKSDGWTELLLEAKAVSETTWVVRGKVWQRGEAEPDAWSISISDQSPPPRGKASIWGHPFSELPIRFDRIQVDAVAAEGEDSK